MTWGGVYEENQYKAFFDPFTQDTGIKVTAVSPMNLARVLAAARSGKMDVDCFTANSMELARARRANVIIPIDWSIVKKEGRRKEEINEHGLGYQTLSTQLVYNPTKFPGGQGPQSWADFWDVRRFPGRRSLYKDVKSAITYALLADGLSFDRLYPLDVDRAFASLDRVKPHITVWWEQGNQSQQLFRDSEVDMMAMWNGRATDLEKAGVPITQVWNEAILHISHYQVTRGGPNPKGAMLLAEYFGRPDLQAHWATIMWYGPLQEKAYDYIDAETARRLPSHPDNIKTQVIPDDEWWAVNHDPVNERFQAWLAS